MGTSELYRLLRGLFSSEELATFLADQPDGEAIDASLPGRGASHDEVATAAARALERRGLVTRALMRSLLHARPGRVRDIRGFAVARGLALPIAEEIALLLDQGFDITARAHLTDILRERGGEPDPVHASTLAFAQIAVTSDETPARSTLADRVRTLAAALDEAPSPPSAQPPRSPLEARAAAIHDEIVAAVQTNEGERAALRLLDLTRLRGGSRDAIQRAILLSAEIHAWARTHESLRTASGEARYAWFRLLGELLTAAEATRPPPPADETTTPVLPRSDTTTVFRARALSKHFKGSPHPQLRDVDLHLRAGTLVGVIGPNGAGKTTLLRIVAGNLAADRGELAYPALDAPCGDLDWRRIHRRIGYVRQHLTPWHGPLVDNLHAWAAHHGLRGQANADAVEYALSRLRLVDLRDATWSQLSGGFQTRFELARALLPRPKLLVLDEPLAPLDILAQQQFLRDLRDLGTAEPDPPAILISSQHIHEVEQVADQILCLRVDGRVEFLGHPQALAGDLTPQVYELSGDLRPEVRDAIVHRFGSTALLDQPHALILWTPPDIDLRALVDLVHTAGGSLDYIRNISRSAARLFWEPQR